GRVNGFFAMASRSRAAQGRPGQQIGPLKEKTVHAHITKQRIHAIVGQVIDELEDRRRKGKSDYVAKLANEVEKHGLAAWQALRDLLPRDDHATSAAGTVTGHHHRPNSHHTCTYDKSAKRLRRNSLQP